MIGLADNRLILIVIFIIAIALIPSSQFSEAQTTSPPNLTSLTVGIPTGKTANIGTDPIKITLSWTDSSGSKWKVLEGTTPVGTVTTRSFTTGSLEKGVAHCYTIQRITTAGVNSGSPSAPKCSHVQPVISLVTQNANKVTITWSQATANNPTANPTGYKVERIYPSGTKTEVCISGSTACNTTTFTSVSPSSPTTKTHVDTVTAGKQICYEIQANWASPRTSMDSDKVCIPGTTQDTTPPVISLKINDVSKIPSDVSTTWYNQNVNVKWAVTDPESGVPSPPVCGEQNVTSDTSGVTFSCGPATNGAGLTTAAVSVTIKRDTVKPVILLTDTADGNPDNIITVQADQTTGRIVNYVTSASDERSGLATGPTCTPASGTLFAIADTPLNCTATDNAGNSATPPFTIRVLPFIFIALGTVNHPIYQNDFTDVIVADPAGNVTVNPDTITVVLSSNAAGGGTANAILTETSPGIFEGKVIFSEQASANSNAPLPANLYAGLGDLVQATYVAPGIPSRGTSITPPQEVINKTPPGEGGAAYIAALPALSWNSDAAHIETSEGITAKRTTGQTGCANTAAIETISVTVKSTLDTTGFPVTLTETSVSSCVLSTTANVKFTAAASNTSVPQIKTVAGATVTVTDSLANTASILILPAPISAPVSGTAIPTTSTDCGVGGDSDSDGICNSWESAGGTTPLTINDYGSYKYSNDGTTCPRLIDDPTPSAGYPTGTNAADPTTYNPPTCPKSTVKDIFYEIDYMPNHKPNYLALLDVINAFKNAPVSSAGCTTCPGPITIHFKINEQISTHDNFIPWSVAAGGVNPLGGFDQIKKLYYGSPSDRVGTPDVVAAKLLSERQVMRYILFSHQQEETANKQSSGYSEIYGNDIEISLGAFSGGTGTRMEQAGTIMHEIGHNIGLNHGGAATNTQNCKPNDISVMNYAFQFTNYVPTRLLDFSRVRLADLNENSLVESNGISSPGAALTTVYGQSTVPVVILSKTLSATASTPISWNRDADTTDTGVVQNINNFGFAGCTSDDGYPALTTLTGSNDWGTINLLFRTTSSTFADGIQALNPIVDGENLGSYEPTSIAFEIGSGDPPVIDVGGPYSVNEGDSVTLDGSGSTDTPPGVVEIYRWNFGDLTQWDTPGEDVLGPQAIIFADDDDNSPFTALLGIWDDSANGVSQSVDVSVANVNPTVGSIGSLAIINEGATLIINNTNHFNFTDPGILDTHTASIDWDDTSSSVGVVSEKLGTAPVLEPPTARIDAIGNVTGTHTYADDDADDKYTVTVTVTDDDLGVGTSARDVTVLNVNPTVTATGSTINEGDTFTGSGSFTDPGADTWTATVDYGDGTGVNTLTLTGKTFALSHTYADDDADDKYTVTVTVTDDDLGVGTTTFDVTVLNVNPTVTASASPSTINEGVTLTGSGSFTDPGADTWTATVDYGDGTGVNTLTLTGKTFALSHIYYNAGTYPVTVSVTDDDLGVGTTTFNVTVNALPAITSSLTVGIPTGKTANIGTDPIKITLSWTDSSASKWNILEGATLVGPGVTTPSFISASTLEKGVEHCYTIQRIHLTTGANIGSPSAPKCSHVQPVISLVSQTASNKVTITWTQATANNPTGNPTGYTVERVYPSGTFTEVCSSGSTACSSSTFTSVSPSSPSTKTHIDTVTAGKFICYEIQASWASPRNNMDSDKVCIQMVP